MEKRQICFIRHGITAGNEQKKYIGSTDEPISDAGRKCLIKRASEGIYGTPDIVFSSPMKRCIETAQILFPEKKL